jgi:HemY protein
MITILKYLLLLLLSAWIGVKISHDPGYVLVSYDTIKIETTLWFMLASIAISIVLFFTVINIIKSFARGISYIPNIFSSKNKNKINKNTNIALEACLSEDWEIAAKHFLLASEASPEIMRSMATIWSASRVDINTVNTYFEKAYFNNPKNSKLLSLLHAKILSSGGKYYEAIQKIMLTHKNNKNNLAALVVLAESYKGLTMWAELEQTIIKIKKLKPKKHELIEKYEIPLYEEKLSVSLPTNLIQTWYNMPNKYKSNPIILLIYISKLAKNGDIKKATSDLEYYINKNFSAELISLYIGLDLNKEARFIKVLLKWLEENPGNINIIHGLGRLHKSHGELSKAISYYEKIQNSKSLSIQLELIDLYIESNMQEKANKAIKNILK